MRKIKEVLRLRSSGLSTREIARSIGVARSTIADYLRRAAAAGVTWPVPDEMDEAALERRLFPAVRPPEASPKLPDYSYIHQELKKKGVTLALLWAEYLVENPDGYRYTQFCHHYRRFSAKLNVSMRQVHKAGEKMFVDFSGQTVPIVDRHTGEVKKAEIFVAVLGASNYTYVQAVWSQDLDNWIDCHTRAFELFGGAAALTVPDNLKSGVNKPCRYEPLLNETYHDMAEFYGTAILPARVRKPKDKPKVEVGVQVVQRWILARLRKRTFFSLAELQHAISELLEWANNKPFAKLDGSRRSMFETLDKPALLPLPKGRYELARFKKARVHIDYHIEIDKHYYSVPYQLVKEEVEVRYTKTTVEVLNKGKRIASHPRSYSAGRHTTLAEHMPKSHREYGEWSPPRIIGWAAKVGPNCEQFVEALIESKRHPAQGFKSAIGVISLAKTYGNDRLESACAIAHGARALSYRTVSDMLKNNLDKAPGPVQQTLPIITHPNIRGAGYYH